MQMCPICLVREANKKNAHLIPWFLIKNCITQEGSGLRDMELSFSIDADSFTKMYTGRGVLPEKIEEFGELHDLQKEKENPYSRDNLICANCEENLSRLEAIFASQFTEKKVKSAYYSKPLNVHNHTVLIDEKYDPSVYELFIQSISYRCSIGCFNGFKLDLNIEKKIAENLRGAFSIENFKKIKANEKLNVPNKFPLITSSFFVSEGEDPTKNFIVVNQSRFPYFIMAGKWMFQLFETEKHLKSSVEWLYGLSAKLKTVETYNIIKGTSHAILLETTAGESISKNLLHFFTEKRITGLKKKIRDLHIHLFNQKPSDMIAQYIFQQYFIHLDHGKPEFDSMVHAFYDLKKLS